MKHNLLDKLGLATSLVCAIHCAVLPLVVGILPLIGMGFMAHGLFDWAMVGLAISVGSFSLLHGHKKHKKHAPICFFIPGIFIILISLFVLTHEDGCEHSHEGEIPYHSIIMAIGGLLVAVSHFINMKLCKSCVTCHDDCEIGTK